MDSWVYLVLVVSFLREEPLLPSGNPLFSIIELYILGGGSNLNTVRFLKLLAKAPENRRSQI